MIFRRVPDPVPVRTGGTGFVVGPPRNRWDEFREPVARRRQWVSAETLSVSAAILGRDHVDGNAGAHLEAGGVVALGHTWACQ